MSSASRVPDDLAFIEWIGGDRKDQYRGASWLKSSFDEHQWHGEFGTDRLTIDFHVRLNDHSLLTEPQHEALLNTFKYWLCVQNHPDATGGRILAAKPTYHHVTRTIRLIDYFLLNGSRFELAKHGLTTLSSSDFRRLLTDLASSNATIHSIYRWSDKVTNYLRAQSLNISEEEFYSIRAAIPAITEISVHPEDRMLALDDEELVRARVYLWTQGLYTKGALSPHFRYAPSSTQLSSIIYKNTLWGKTLSALPEELCFGPIERYGREYSPVHVRTNLENALSDKALAKWSRTLRSLGLLAETGSPIPLSAFEVFSQRGFLETLKLKPTGRFRSLPHDVVLMAFRNAVEFVFKYGDDLIDSYLQLAKAAKANDLSIASYAGQKGVRCILTENASRMGIRTWHLGQYISLSEANPAKRGEHRPPAKNYFSRFRKNEGLYELLGVLYGAIQICVGTLMARRQGELLDLVAGECLDKTKRYLVFENRKSGIDAMRNVEARPIPEVAVRMIGMLERMQAGLIEIGALQKPTHLFAIPHRAGISLVHDHTAFNTALDRFCDYFELPLSEKGERYYVRQHQLRRFFAMLFFWGRSFGGMDTLRWFLGHTDVEHLYHYITVAFPRFPGHIR